MQKPSTKPNPEWFAPATARVLEGMHVLLEANGPRALEQRSAELLGAELHRAVSQGKSGLRFEPWLEEVADATVQRVFDGLKQRDTAWEAAWRLLCGLDGIAAPLVPGVRAAMRKPKRKVRAASAWHRLPDWLELMPKLRATGEVWEAHDAYGTRFAVVAGFEYPGGVDPHYFLFDIDAAGFVSLVHGGVFDSVAEAGLAWRELAGSAAVDAELTPVEATDRLLCLAYCDLGMAGYIIGFESREVMDNWFRAVGRVNLVASALDAKGTPLPQRRSLHSDLDIDPMVEGFSAWHESRHGAPPDEEAVETLAEEWLEGSLPGTEHAVPPKRIEHNLALINDWIEDSTQSEVKRILPEWVRWNGERSSLPDHLVKPSVALAERGS